MATERDQLTVEGAVPAPAPPATRETHVTVIRPATRMPRLDVRELWRFRELLWIFVWRDVKVRYKQTLIGAGWAIFQPALTAFVYTIIFGKFARFPSGGIYYPVFVYAGLLPWQYFSSSLTQSSFSLVQNRNLVTKVWFPRVLMPIASVLVPIVDFLLALIVLFGLMAWYGYAPGWPEVLLAPGFLLLATATALGIGLGLSAVNVRYRDVPFVIPVFLQVLPFLSGVPYDVSELPEHWQWILAFNPITAVISGWRWVMLGSPPPVFGQVAVGTAVAISLLAIGLAYFRSSEPRFADTI